MKQHILILLLAVLSISAHAAEKRHIRKSDKTADAPAPKKKSQDKATFGQKVSFLTAFVTTAVLTQSQNNAMVQH